jgi:chloramphenicol 3-O phosphotransferase
VQAGLVVVLDGPSGVGRSTTLAALQQAWPQVRGGPLLDIGLDRAVAALGRPRWRWWDLIEHHEPDRDGGLKVGWGPLGREFVAGLHRAAAAWAAAGFDVVLDHVLVDHATVSDLRATLADLEVVHVGLTCDLDVLEAREEETDGAVPGRAAAQWARSRAVRGRDALLDTTEATTEEIVEVLLEVVRTRLDRTSGR